MNWEPEQVSGRAWVAVGVEARTRVALHVRLGRGIEHRRDAGRCGLMGAAGLLTAHDLAVDQLHLPAELLRQVPPDLNRDRLWLKVSVRG
jgi:hypothetical protein